MSYVRLATSSKKAVEGVLTLKKSLWPAFILAGMSTGCSLETGVDRETPEERARELRALPYASWNPIEHEDKEGVVVHHAQRAHPGLNLFNSLVTTRASLMSMDGKEIHAWSRETGAKWEHIEPFPNGDLLVLNDNPRKLIRLDWDSNLLWTQDVYVHHDVDVSDKGDIYVLSASDEMVDYNGLDIPLRNHSILVLSPDGQLLREISFLPLLRHLLDMEKLQQFVATGGEIDYGFRFEGDFVDVFHVNTLSIIDRSVNEFFQEGFVLFAARSLNTIGVIDLEAEKLVWNWGENDLDWPHQPVLLDSGNVMIFDNGTHRKYSRIVELEPRSREIVWEYEAEPRESFFSLMMGGVQDLPNGNILVTESTKGRAFEITRNGDVVWEFYNPDVNEARDKRASIYRMRRIPTEFLDPGLFPEARVSRPTN